MKTCLLHSRRGFTLIELLVVIAIVSVLAALAMPVIKSVNSKVKVTQCSANLHQMAIALGSYAADHQGEWCYPEDNRNFPPNQLGTWISRVIKDGTGTLAGSGKLFPYLNDKRIYVCPAHTSNLQALKRPGNDNSVPTGALPCDYVTRGFNQSLNPVNPQFRKLAAMDRRAIVSCSFAYAPSNPKDYPLSWHDGTYPVLFSDGSVSTIKFPAGAVNPASPPDINSNPAMQMHIWDYFDGKTPGLSL